MPYSLWTALDQVVAALLSLSLCLSLQSFCVQIFLFLFLLILFNSSSMYPVHTLYVGLHVVTVYFLSVKWNALDRK